MHSISYMLNQTLFVLKIILRIHTFIVNMYIYVICICIYIHIVHVVVVLK